MNTRETNVAWDPKLVRVEYLDDEGNPYYCSFDSSRRKPNEASKSGTRSEPHYPENRLRRIPFRTRRLAMVVVTGAVDEEIVIDGRIRIRILAVDGEEVYLELNFPEFVRLGRNGAREQQDESGRWPTRSA